MKILNVLYKNGNYLKENNVICIKCDAHFLYYRKKSDNPSIILPFIKIDVTKIKEWAVV